MGTYPEHHFRRVIAGDIESVRGRLCQALEDFNYIVLSENPIHAKRPRQKSIWVSMVLDYDVQLTVALKPISSASTQATFDYTIEQLFTKGEMQALEREAEAIIALASTVSVDAFCPACGAASAGAVHAGTTQAGAVRFCRACGKPIARHQLPAEIEVMRLTASASGSQIELTLGLCLCFLTLLISLPMILFTSTKGMVFGWMLLALGESLGAFFLSLGMRRLHRAINASAAPPHDEVPRAVTAQARVELAPPPASVTEGTTELIEPEPLSSSSKSAPISRNAPS